MAFPPLVRPFVAAVLLVLSVLVLVAGPAAAQELEPLVGQLADRDFAAKIAAVEALGATGNPRAVPVLDAMLAGRLAVRPADGRLVIVIDRSGTALNSSSEPSAELVPEALVSSESG